MNNIYDNGALMLGNLEDIITYIENDETLECWEFENLLEELKDLRGKATIVMVNYDNPMGYSLDYWNNDDIVKPKETRTCSECGKEMTEGYVIDNGMEYYCNAECLAKHYTDEEWADLYATGDSYWTSWEE